MPPWFAESGNDSLKPHWALSTDPELGTVRLVLCPEPSMKRRVVITGMGAITPLGHSVAELYQNQLEGKSGVAPITLFDASKFPDQIRGRGQELRPGALDQGPGALGRFGRQQPLRRRRRPAGPRRRRSSGRCQGRSHALRRLPGIGRRHPGLPQHGVPDCPKLSAGKEHGGHRGLHGGRSRALSPGPRIRARAAHHAGPSGRLFRSGRAQLQLFDRLRRQQPGRGRGLRADSPG